MFELGVNLPWWSCGHDFGPRPPAWAGSPGHDLEARRADLHELGELGLRVVRLWLLAGGVNYPVGQSTDAFADARAWDSGPRRERLTQRERLAARIGQLAARGRALPEQYALRGAPPRLPRAFLDDFAATLDAAADAGVRLVPSLLSFEMLLPLRPFETRAKPRSRGRATWVIGDAREAFLDATLEPLLDVCEGRREAIRAVEIVNEPGWAARQRPGARGARAALREAWSARRAPRVEGSAIGELLVEGVRRVARRGFTATVGFAHHHEPWLPREHLRALRSLADEGRYIHQVHHYPRMGQTATLLPASACAIRPVWVGEMATTRARRWWDAGLAEDDPTRFLERRVAHVRAQGYDGALLWSVHAKDQQSGWDDAVKQQVARLSDPA